MNNIWKNILILFTVVLITSEIGCARNKHTPGGVLVIDDFESREYINLFGGASGAWEKDPSDQDEFCRADFVQTEINKNKTTALHLFYKVTPSDYNGYYSKLNGIDATSYKYLELYLKSDSEKLSTFKIELKNSLDEAGYYYVTGIEKDWISIKIPLSGFTGINSFNKLKELIFTFEGDKLGNSEGGLFVDNIRFIDSKYAYSTLREAVKEESEVRVKIIDGNLELLSDDELLELISKKAFNYFWNESSIKTGFIKDRSTPDSPASIAAIGFGLTAICIADSRGWVSHIEGYKRVKKILTAIANRAANKNGIYFHYLEPDTGKRAWNSEVSTIDTALLLGGIIVTREYFPENDIKELCDRIYENINWNWIMEPKSKALYMGWTPESEFNGFIRWDMFAEEMIMYILGMGAAKNGLPEESWHSFRRKVKKYKKFTYIYCESESLFTYLYSHAFIDFRDKHDRYADYWKNSKNAIKAGIAFSENYKGEYRTYSEGFWGISASDGPDGYKNYGATELLFAHDGTIPPYAICGSVPFMPKKAISTLRKLLIRYRGRLWDDDYGFVSAFNLNKNWFSTEHIGIDLGISLLMIENYRTEFVWNYFMKNKNVKLGMKKAGFKPGTKKLKTDRDTIKKKRKLIQKQYFARRISSPDELRKEDFVKFNLLTDIEYGEIEDSNDLSAEFAFVWDNDFLYLTVDVNDNIIRANKEKEELYQDDCVELYLNPDSDFLVWNNKEDFQIGFAPDSQEEKPVKYAFFQEEDPEEDIVLKVKNKSGGYSIQAGIRWSFLNVIPEKGKVIGMSVAVHDVDKSGESGKKLNWSFKNTAGGIKLGELILR